MCWVEYLPNWIIAIAAFYGLFIWKKKFFYERKISIIDDFHDTVNDFILKIRSSLQILEMMQSSISIYEDNFQKDAHRQKSFTSGLEEFIEKLGKSYSVQLNNRLIDLPIQHIYTLSTKICAFNKIRDSCLALNCYNQLEWFYDSVQKTANKLDMKALNYENPEVVEQMNQLTELNANELKKSLERAEQLMLEFVRKNYE